MQNKLELHKIINYFNELLLLLLFQDYLKSMHTAKTTGNKKKKKIMGSWRGQTIESVRWISRSASPLASSKESRKKSRGGSERERESLWKFADVRRGHSVS